MFDIYLTMGSLFIPDLDDLIQRFPRIADPTVQQRMKDDIKQGYRFLELDLPEDTAFDLLRRLKTGRALGCIVNSAYRYPKISPEQASIIAEQVLNKQAEQEFPDIAFEPMQFYLNQVTTWSFVRGSRELARQFIVPGAIFVDVDKLDGHIWRPEEFKQLKRG